MAERPLQETGGKARRRPAGDAGFTLIELIIVIVLIGALAAVTSVFIVQPFEASEDLERRAALVDSADHALDRMTREARRALPNSVRVHSADHVEFIHVRTAGRYRRLPGDGSTSTFVPARSSDDFEVLGGLLHHEELVAGAAGTDCANGNRDCMSVYNTGQTGLDAYDGDNIAAVTGVPGSSTIEYDTGAGGPAFATHSPQQRFYVFDAVVSYLCTAGALYRFENYGLTGSAPSLDPATDDGRLVAKHVSDCDFDYEPGSSERRALLTVRLDLARGGEEIFLLDQAQVPNAP